MREAASPAWRNVKKGYVHSNLLWRALGTSPFFRIEMNLSCTNESKFYARSKNVCSWMLGRCMTVSTTFVQLLIDIAAGGTLTKKKPFRFLTRDRIGDCTMDRYARSARLILITTSRVFLQQQQYTGISMSPS